MDITLLDIVLGTCSRDVCSDTCPSTGLSCCSHQSFAIIFKVVTKFKAQN